MKTLKHNPVLTSSHSATTKAAHVIPQLPSITLGQDYANPLDYDHPWPSMGDFAKLLALRYDANRARHAYYRCLHLIEFPQGKQSQKSSRNPGQECAFGRLVAWTTCVTICVTKL